MINKKHKKSIKRKRIVVRKKKVAILKSREPSVVGYHRELVASLKNYKEGSSEHKKVSKIIKSYEDWRKIQNDAKKKPTKPIPMYRVVILTRRLDKIVQAIKDCKSNEKLKGLKEKKKILEIKLKNYV